MPFLASAWIGRVAAGLSVVVLLLAIALVVLGVQNRSLQDQVAGGRQQLNRAQTFAGLDNSLVQLLAKTAAEKNDDALKDLLSHNGVTFKVEANSAANGAAHNSAQAAQ